MKEAKKRPPLPIVVRWMVKNDLFSMLEIEKDVYDQPWKEKDFTDCVQLPRRYGIMVAETRGRLVGYLIHQQLNRNLYIVNLAVRRTHWRLQIGTRLVECLIELMKRESCRKIIAEIPDIELRSQLFLKSCGFKAEKIVHNYYDDPDEDMYWMVYHPG